MNFPIAHVWVVDDSDDGTAGVVQAWLDDGDTHIHRVRPQARTGKGDALNDAYRTVKLWMGRHADGRPAPNCLEVCAAEHLFGDPGLGAVQVDVRMVNAGVRQAGASSWRRTFGSALVRVQDLEFRTAIAAIRMSRGVTGTLSMGGNGQFTRLSALDSIAGWRTGFSTDTHVHQEGLYDLRRLLVQPWMRLLGTLVYPIPVILPAHRALAAPAEVWTWFTDGAWILFTVYGAFGLLPFVLWGPVYRARRAPETSVARLGPPRAREQHLGQDAPRHRAGADGPPLTADLPGPRPA